MTHQRFAHHDGEELEALVAHPTRDYLSLTIASVAHLDEVFSNTTKRDFVCILIGTDSQPVAFRAEHHRRETGPRKPDLQTVHKRIGWGVASGVK